MAPGFQQIMAHQIVAIRSARAINTDTDQGYWPWRFQRERVNDGTGESPAYSITKQPVLSSDHKWTDVIFGLVIADINIAVFEEWVGCETRVLPASNAENSTNLYLISLIFPVLSWKSVTRFLKNVLMAS